jgi:AcrR family transcriptional regulator
LIEAALAEFSEKGYEAATVTGIAERAGVTTGALYAHFQGKLDLLLQALGLTPAHELFENLAEVATQPWTRVAHLLGENMAAAPDHSTLLLLDAIVAARRDPRVAEILRDGLATYETTMTRATEAGVVLGLLDPGLPAEDLSRVLILLALGRLVVAAIDAPAPSGDAYERIAELLLQSSGAVADDSPSAAIAHVRSRARLLARARRDLTDSVADAVENGHSLRQVGNAAGVSHERVRQILRDRES